MRTTDNAWCARRTLRAGVIETIILRRHTSDKIQPVPTLCVVTLLWTLCVRRVGTRSVSGGLPTRTADDVELSKSARKKLEKERAKHKKMLAKNKK